LTENNIKNTAANYKRPSHQGKGERHVARKREKYHNFLFGQSPMPASNKVQVHRERKDREEELIPHKEDMSLPWVMDSSRYLFMEGGIAEGKVVMRAHVGSERDRCLMRE
jgi:hypothetical protein